MLATASGWVMYGSPERRNWSACRSSATSYAFCSSDTLAFGKISRCTATSGSSTGLTALRWAVIRRASRARTRRDALVEVLGISSGCVSGMWARGGDSTACPVPGSSAMAVTSLFA